MIINFEDNAIIYYNDYTKLTLKKYYENLGILILMFGNWIKKDNSNDRKIATNKQDNYSSDGSKENDR